MVRRQFRRAFKLKAVRQVKRPWGFGDPAHLWFKYGRGRIATMDQGAHRGSRVGVPGPGPVQAGTAEVGSAAARSYKAQGGTRHPKKPWPTLRGFRYEVWLRCKTSRDLADYGGFAKRSAFHAVASTPGRPVARYPGTQRRRSRRTGQGQLRRQ